MTETLFPSINGAVISPDGRYRYLLWRQLMAGADEPGTCVFIMLNPSTADGTVDDPTIRRCTGFADREGCTRLEVVNLFAWRSTDPKALITADDPIGPDNDGYVREAIRDADLVICAWGTRAPRKDSRAIDAMRRALADNRATPYCFGLTKDGHPGHPLYMPAAQHLVPFEL